MNEYVLYGFMLRVVQAFASASPFILSGLLVAGVFRRLLGREKTVAFFGGSTKRSLIQAWGIGMLLPICSLGVIPVIRELRRMGLKGGTILAFAMSAPLFNPLSLLYGLTLSEPWAILTFAFCSLIIVTCVGLAWDSIFPHSAQAETPPKAVNEGMKRMLAVAVASLREAGGWSAVYIAIGILGVAALSLFLPHGALQADMNGDNILAPLTMTAIAIPVYATPMLAMSQLGMMFQHANSPGAAFVLLALGAGMNLGLVIWMWRQYGLKRSLAWFGILLAIVVGLAYGVDRPLYPHDIEPADHTHAFDIYCQPFHGHESNLAEQFKLKVERTIEVYEQYAGIILLAVMLCGLMINLVDRQHNLEAWLEQKPDEEAPRGFDVVLPNWVLGGVALCGLVSVSVVGCYAYYPEPKEVLAEMDIVKAEALSAAMTGDEASANYWIEIYDDWTRKLEVGTMLRDWKLSEYHRMKGRILREQLELLEHEVEDQELAEVRTLVAKVSRSQGRLKYAYLDER